MNLDLLFCGIILISIFLCETASHLYTIRKGISKRQTTALTNAILLTCSHVIYQGIIWKTPIRFTFFPKLILIILIGVAIELAVALDLKSISLKKEKRREKIGIMATLFFIIAFVFGEAILSNFVNASIFGGDNWFSDTILSLLRAESIGAVITFLAIGGFVLIMGKVRASGSISTLGFFLVIGLPYFDVMNTLFSDNIESEVEQSPIYIAFGNLGFAIILYAIIKLILYLLIVSILLVFISMIDEV